MSQQAAIMVHVQNQVVLKARLISTTPQKTREAVERRMVIEDVVE